MTPPTRQKAAPLVATAMLEQLDEASSGFRASRSPSSTPGGQVLRAGARARPLPGGIAAALRAGAQRSTAPGCSTAATGRIPRCSCRPWPRATLRGGDHRPHARVPERAAPAGHARGDYLHASVTAEKARNFLAQVLALNVELLVAGERLRGRARVALGRANAAVPLPAEPHRLRRRFEHWSGDWRILSQRPIRSIGSSR